MTNTTISGLPVKPNLPPEILNDHSLPWEDKIDYDQLSLAFLSERYQWPPELLEQLSRCGFNKAQFEQIARALVLTEAISFTEGFQLGKS